MISKLFEINKIVSKELWFDFAVKSFDGFTLTVSGGIDVYNKQLLEITFANVSFVSLKGDWKRNDELNFIEILTGERSETLKRKYFIESYHTVFLLNHEDLTDSNQFIVAAEKIDYIYNFDNS